VHRPEWLCEGAPLIVRGRFVFLPKNQPCLFTQVCAPTRVVVRGRTFDCAWQICISTHKPTLFVHAGLCTDQSGCAKAHLWLCVADLYFYPYTNPVCSRRFVHRPEWLCEGAPLIVRDRSDGRLSGAGFVRSVSAGKHNVWNPESRLVNPLLYCDKLMKKEERGRKFNTGKVGFVEGLCLCNHHSFCLMYMLLWWFVFRICRALFLPVYSVHQLMFGLFFVM